MLDVAAWKGDKVADHVDTLQQCARYSSDNSIAIMALFTIHIPTQLAVNDTNPSYMLTCIAQYDLELLPYSVQSLLETIFFTGLVLCLLTICKKHKTFHLKWFAV